MGFVTDDGTHELHLASVVRGGSGSSYRSVGGDEQVHITRAGDGRDLPPWQQWWAPLDSVMAYALTCDCAANRIRTTGRSGRLTNTVLARWERVNDPHAEDLDAGRVYAAPGQDAMDLSDRPDVETAMLRLWEEHLAPGRRTAQLEAAWARHRQALADVDDAVAAARGAGLSWVDIGRATSMTRQSARERWT